jgi:Flp pilus assembly protein TadD
MRPLTIRLGLLTLALTAGSASAVRGQGQPQVTELIAAGDQAWTAGKYDDALRLYSAVLTRDSASARATFRAATILGWRNDFDRSVALFRKYLTLSPGDADGRVALARVLAWRGDYRQALAICDSVLEAVADSRDAALLAGQTLAWSGHLEAAANRYNQWLERHPNDAEAWNGLAQVWRWAGRSERARDALRHALAVEPTNAAALGQLEWMEVALAPSLEPAVTSTDDSDRNRTLTYLLRAGLPAPWNARVQTDASFRTADYGVAHGSSATVRASSSWTPLDRTWTLQGELGLAQLDGNDGASAHTAHTEPLGSLRWSGRVAPRLSLGADVSHTAFDETATLIFSGIATTTVGADAHITLRPRLSLIANSGWTRLIGGSSPNNRLEGSGALRWTLTKTLSVTASMRGFGYDHSANDGYFAPRRYVLSEGSARLNLGGELGWALDTEVGLGDQRITGFDSSNASRFAQRGTMKVAYRPAAGVEWSLGATFANVASLTTISSANYRAFSLALGGRLRL